MEKLSKYNMHPQQRPRPNWEIHMDWENDV